jgi:phosphohistidine phosphatase
MKLYILRHAIAEARRPNLSDSRRCLTEEGLKELQQAVRSLRELGVRPDLILSSPYKRAWDTALVAARLLRRRKPQELEALKPDGSPQRIWAGLRPHAAAKSIMVVGHEPLLTEFAAFLLNTPQLSINLKKSGFIRIDLSAVQTERPAGQLRWLLTPSQLARMA